MQRSIVVGVSLVLVGMALAGCTQPSPGGKAELKVGTILPITGSLEAYGPPGRVAVEKATAQVNGAADARFRMTLRHENSETAAAAGAAAAQRLRSDGVTAVVGAYASGVTRAVMEVTQPNRIVTISPASTSPALTDYNDNFTEDQRYFFRTSPSDALQGKVAAAYAIEKNWTRVVLLYDNNPYGNGLRATFTQAFQSASVGTGGVQARTVSSHAFAEGQTSYDSVLQTALAGCTSPTASACPSGFFFVGYPTEGTQMMKDWWARSAWRGIPWLLSEGVQTQSFFDGLRGQGIRVEGMEGTAPIGTGPGFDAFKAILGAEPTLFQAQAYDATMLIALAAEKAGSTDGAAMRAQVRAVANPPGTQVGPGDFNRAAQLLKQGQDIDYEGAGGSQNVDEFGDPTSSYEIYVIGADGKIGRRCVVPEAEVTRDPVRLPAACAPGAGMTPPAPPPTPPAPPGNQTNATLRMLESGGTAPRLWSISPGNLSRAANQSFTLRVESPSGNAAPHNLTIVQGTAATQVAAHEPHIEPGQSANLLVQGLAPGSYTYYCAVTGHRALGMEGTLVVA